MATHRQPAATAIIPRADCVRQSSRLAAARGALLGPECSGLGGSADVRLWPFAFGVGAGAHGGRSFSGRLKGPPV